MDIDQPQNPSTNAEDFAALVQGDISFAKLFAGAEQRQLLLAEIGRDAATQAIGGSVEVRTLCPVSLPVIAHSFGSKASRVLIIDPGQKSQSRAHEKLRMRYPGKTANALADIVRIMALPSTSRLAEAMAAVLKLRFRHFDTGWRVRPSGHFSRAVYIEVERGYVGEISFQNAGQFRSGNRSHPLYEVVRSITGPSHEPDVAHVPRLTDRGTIAARCNVSLVRAGLDALAIFSAEDFGPERYWRTYYSLLRMVQEIHEHAVRRAGGDWQALYGDCVSQFNANKAYVDRLRVA